MREVNNELYKIQFLDNNSRNILILIGFFCHHYDEYLKAWEKYKHDKKKNRTGQPPNINEITKSRKIEQTQPSNRKRVRIFHLFKN